MLVSGLYAGIGGFELGLERSGHRTIFMSEKDTRALAVIRHRFPRVAIDTDVTTLRSLPGETEVVTAGFPCQNLAMAGDKSGLKGKKSRIIDSLFRLLKEQRVPWVVIENVYFMLHLAGGAAMHQLLESLEELGYRWAYRVVESRSFGLAQRRRRVFIVASQCEDPRNVLLSDDIPEPDWPQVDLGKPIGFYWTEGRSGHGITADAVPPLKAGSGLGIPSPPAVLLPSGRVVTPPIEVCEQLQGFPGDWTSALQDPGNKRFRWHLVGNAVSVPVAGWIGRKLENPEQYDSSKDTPLTEGSRWPTAAWHMGGQRMTARVSEHILCCPPGRLSAFATEEWPDLSLRALRGFVRRAREGRLRYPGGFLQALEANSEAVAVD